MSFPKILIFLLFLFIGNVAVAISSSEAITEVVTRRQSDMKAMAVSVKLIGSMFKEENTYNWRDFKNAAETIESKAGSALLRNFPGNPVAAGSSANADIAIDRENFDRLASELAAYANALAFSAAHHRSQMSKDMRMKPGEVVVGGPFSKKREAVAATAPEISAEHTFHMMLQTCTACHSKFRTKSN